MLAAVWNVTRILLWDLIRRHMAQSLTVIYFMLWVPILYCLLPWASKVPRHAWGVSFSMMLAMGLKVIIMTVPDNSLTDRLLMILVLFPIVRELSGILVRNIARSLCGALIHPTENPSEEIAGKPVRSTFIWLLVMWWQSGFTTAVRVIVVQYDPVVLTVVMFLCAVVEIVVRLSVRWRDQQIDRMQHKLSQWFWPAEQTDSPGGPTVLVVGVTPHSTHWDSESGRASPGPRFVFEDVNTLPKEEFYNVVHITNNIVEYSAIFGVHATIWLFQGSMLSMPLDFYTHLPGPFGKPDLLSRLGTSLAIQLAFELFTDIFCLFCEQLRAYDLRASWERLNKKQLILMVMWNGFWTAHILFYTVRRESTPCIGRNVCACTHTELHPGGLLQQYCFWMYPDTNGYSNSTVAAPASA